MHAFAQDAFGLGDMGIRELFGGEIGLHAFPPLERPTWPLL